MLLREYSVRTEKTPQHKKHIHHKHTTLATGENKSSSGKQPSGPAAICFGAGHRPARQAGGFKANGGVGWEVFVCVCNSL